MSSPIKIAMISAHSCPVGDLGAKDTGGMSVYIREIARELGEKGNTVHVYTRIHDPNDPIYVNLGGQAQLIHLKAGPKARLAKGEVYRSLPEFISSLENFWRDNHLHYDIVFSHYWLSGLVGQHLQKSRRIPLVMMYHTLGAAKNAIGIGEEEPQIRIISERDSIRACQRILVPTERERQNIMKYYGAFSDKIGIVPCGVNLEQFIPIERRLAREKAGVTDQKILLFVGRIDPLKGIDQLLKAMARLPTQIGLRLMIIGGDAYSRQEMERLKQLACALGIRELIDFRGMVKHDQLPYYYGAADLCLLPSYYESFGLVALEALACGTPVLATDVGDLINIIRQGETGFVVEDNSPEKLAAGISRFLAGPELTDASVLINRASVNRFNWSNIADSVIRELHHALDAPWASAIEPYSEMTTRMADNGLETNKREFI
jgi:D-inositol-3-phosphate glycosyltransferase